MTGKFLSHTGKEYSALKQSNNDTVDQAVEQQYVPAKNPLRACFKILVSLLCLTAAFLAGAYFHAQGHGESSHFNAGLDASLCQNATIRQEWRSLSKEDKLEYLRAVQCSQALPSRIGVEQSMNEDFAWIHSRYGNSSHNAASFLSWHRYYVHLHEKMLRDECGFRGDIPYWDWSLDWEDLYASPIWDVELGFGGSGNKSLKSVAHGYCVTEGPFANLRLENFGSQRLPHCLSRGFTPDDREWLRARGERLSPLALQRLLKEEDYRVFNLGLEFGAHNSIPQIVRGDFWRLTAPADPIFFLHHAQIDHMWWKWQRYAPQRFWSYNGEVNTLQGEFERAASLEDPLEVGTLASRVTVADIMSTESDLLCYRY